MNRVGDNLIHYGTNERIIKAFLANNVEFIVIGGLAVSWYCKNRQADDMDILVNPTSENSSRTFLALKSLDMSGFISESFTKFGLQIPLKQFYYAELLTPRSDGPSYSEIESSAINANIFSMPIRLPSISSLILLKELAVVNCVEAEKEKHLKDIEFLKNSAK